MYEIKAKRSVHMHDNLLAIFMNKKKFIEGVRSFL